MGARGQAVVETTSATALAAQSDGGCCRRWSASQAAGRSSPSLALGPVVGESTKDGAKVLEGRRADQVAVDDEVCSIANRQAPSSEPANKKLRRPMAVRRG
jgi:hypothetical protein